MPNCEAVFEQNGTKTPHIKFKALKKIQIGDELSINYRLKKIPGKQIECLYQTLYWIDLKINIYTFYIFRLYYIYIIFNFISL